MTSSLFVDVRANMNGKPYRPAGAIFAVEGTAYAGAPAPPQPLINDGSGFWAGFSSGIVGGLINEADGLWASQCIGYPAATYPMWPSVQQGRVTLTTTVRGYAADYLKQNGTYEGLVILLTGYSQGAMVVMQSYLLDLVALHPYIYRVYLFGDPFRCPGIAHGNELAGQALPPTVNGQITGGIAGPLDYSAAVANVLAPDGKFVINSFVNPGDLYADAPVGANPWSGEATVGGVETQIFNIVQQASFIDVLELARDLGHPIATVEAIVNAGTFFAQGVSAPHYQYFDAMLAAINDALVLGNSLPHRLGV